MDKFKEIGALVVTLVTGAITVWWLIVVARHLNVAPTVDASGKVSLDEFQRAKDILLVVLPLFSASLAYWVGNQGVASAKKDTATAQAKLETVLGVSSDENLLNKATSAQPKLFAQEPSR